MLKDGVGNLSEMRLAFLTLFLIYTTRLEQLYMMVLGRNKCARADVYTSVRVLVSVSELTMIE